MLTMESEVWAPILADPLDWPPSSDIIPLPSQVEEYFNYVYNNYALAIDHFVDDPRETRRNLYSGGYSPRENWRRGPRAPRKRRISFRKKSKSRICPKKPPLKCRKINKRWDDVEVAKLVEGVERYGTGNWTEVKLHCFSDSDRDPIPLKDKWRNLLRACGVPCNSKRKEKPQQKMYFPLDASVIERIQMLAIKLGLHIENKGDHREKNN